MVGPFEDGPYKYVCRACWALPFTYFPDKVLAKCGECWLPPGRSRHHHFRVRDRMYPTPRDTPPSREKPSREPR